MKIILNLAFVFAIVLLSSCNFTENIDQLQEKANQQFGDQHFKTAIALIELHKIRYGHYPESFDSLKYTGEWDKMVNSSITYTKLDSGYSLDLTNGWIGKPDSLKYPAEFWNGIGLVRSNLKK
ncbi:MAG: hypothetical protein JWQ25_510 [Daejeonella sp.]|nr:hypothetical protein [Daejeonella sp.]